MQFGIIAESDYICTSVPVNKEAASGCSDGGIGRHEGLKIPWAVMSVRVRFPFLGPNQNPEPILAVRDFFNDFSKILCGAFGPGILEEVTAAQQGQEISDFLWDLIRNE